MELADVIAKRRMVRNFAPDPIPRVARDRIFEAMLQGPSAGFTQGFEFLTFEGSQTVEFWEIAWPKPERSGPHVGIIDAPLVIVPCANKSAYIERYAEPDKGWTDRDESRWSAPYWLIDTAFAAMLGMLTVTDLGLGSLFFALKHADAVRAAFGIPEAFFPIGALAIGVPAPDSPSPSTSRARKPATQAFHSNLWAPGE